MSGYAKDRFGYKEVLRQLRKLTPNKFKKNIVSKFGNFYYFCDIQQDNFK